MPDLTPTQRAERILAHIKDAYILLDDAWRIIEVNPALTAMSGRSRDSLLGLSHWDAFPASRTNKAWGAYHQVRDTGVEAHFTEHYLGEGYDFYLEVDAYPTEEGGVAIFFRDISDRVRADLAREQSEQRYALAARVTSNVIWQWDLTADVIAWGEGFSAVFGYPETAVAQSGEDWAQCIHPEDRPRVLSTIAAALHDERIADRWEDAYRFHRADGSWAYVVDRAYITRDQQGHAVSMLGAMEDVTSRALLEQQLRQAQKMEAVGQLAGGIAHDFNNLLTIISGTLELVRADLTPQHPSAPDLAEIAAAADRARTLVRQLLTFSRKQVVHPQPVRVGELVQGTQKLLRRIIGEEIAVDLHVEDHGAFVEADPGQLEQVIMNLVVNARDACLTPLHGHRGTGGSISIDVAVVTVSAAGEPWTSLPPGTYVQLEVCDTGHGMSAETRAHVFEPFFTTKEPGAGTGLGLSTVFGIIQQAHGAIGLESAPGEGTTVTIRLPVLPMGDEHAVNVRSASTVCGSGGTILLVEDEAAVRSLLLRLLERSGYRVVQARHGADALRLWRRQRDQIKAVVSDVRMPEMGGRELMAHIHAESPRLPVVFVSGYADELAGSLGENEVLVEKPFTSDGVLRALADLLAVAAH